MDASAVADYLKKNPAFFEDYADVVAQIFVPHPHGGHAIPIAERQMLALRDRAYELEQRLHELIAHLHAGRTRAAALMGHGFERLGTVARDGGARAA